MQNLIIISALLLLFVACTRAQTSGSNTLDQSVFSEKINTENTVLIDVRTAAEFSNGHIPNAVNIDVNQPDFDSKIENLDKSKTCLVYCQAGARSNKAMKIMEKTGFSTVFELKGGFSGWTGEKIK